MNTLLLYATGHQQTVEQLTELLRCRAFIEQQHNEHWLVGDGFLDDITFMGCSPAVALSPEDAEDYCYVMVHKVASWQFFSGENTQPPRCTQCSSVQPDWNDVLLNSVCGDCDIVARASQWRWRRMAAVVNAPVIEIAHIYPHEAIPGPNLLAALEQLCGISWQYAWLQNRIIRTCEDI